MANRFLGTFIPGTEKIVAAMLEEAAQEVRTVRLMSGAAEFEMGPGQRLEIPCFNNLFRVLYSAKTRPDKAGLDKFVRSLPEASVDWPAARAKGERGKSFRLVTSCQNELTGVSKAAKAALERRTAQETGMKVDRSLPDREFWALARREGTAYFMKRLTRHRAYDKLLHPGELHPELAYMMCWLAGRSSVVLDPFCGYGAIPAQWCKWFSYERLMAFDLNEEALAYAKEKLGGAANIRVERRDALKLAEQLPPESIDAIVTDPPWGLYQGLEVPLDEFYGEMLEQFEQLLKPEGRAVVLTAGKNELASALERTARLTPEARYDILASGKKCGLFVLRRR